MLEKEKMGQRLNEVRKLRGLSSDALAELCEVNSGGYIRQLEHGSKSPSLALLVDLCNTLAISPKYLLMDSLNQYTESSPEADISDKLKLLTQEQLELLVTMVDKMIEQHKRI